MTFMEKVAERHPDLVRCAADKPFRTVAFATRRGRKQGTLLHLVIVRDGTASKTACRLDSGGYFPREIRTKMKKTFGVDKTQGVATCRNCVDISMDEQRRRQAIHKKNGGV